ncbi:hypothetical protein OROMI_018275 [Orobanche minor]
MFSGADLTAVAHKAGNLAMKRIVDKRKDELSNEQKGKRSCQMVQPSSRKEGFFAVPNVNFLKIMRIWGGLSNRLLLYGSPGCGKTLIHIRGPELLNKYAGESELANIQSTETCSQCILSSMSLVDALTTKHGQEGGCVVERLLNQVTADRTGWLTTEKGVYVVGVTNRPEVMDDAVLQPERFGKLMYVPLPSAEERGMILRALARKKPIDADADLMALAKDSRLRFDPCDTDKDNTIAKKTRPIREIRRPRRYVE